MANIDFQSVIDLGKAVNYLTKYVTKPDKDMSYGMHHTIKLLIHEHLNSGKSVKTVLQKIMGKLLGSRIVFKQKTYHLINNMGIVHCTHNFVNIKSKG